MIAPRIIAVVGLTSLCACSDPPSKPVDRVDPPALEADREHAEFRRKAHADALAKALPLALAAATAADPFTAWQIGAGPPAIPPLAIGERLMLAKHVEAAELALRDIEEVHLEPSGVVLLRAIRFAINRLNDELERRPSLRQDPLVPVRAVARVLDELEHRLVFDDCDAGCEALTEQLAAALPGTRSQVSAASPAATRRAASLAAAQAERCRTLAARPLLAERAQLRAGLEQLATALDEQRGWLDELAAALPKAKATHVWTAKPAPLRPGGVSEIERLPDVLGAQALSRRFAVEERLVLDPKRDISRVAAHIRRWQALRATLVPEPAPAQTASPVDAERCEATLGRVREGLARVDGVAAPQLDCRRYVDLFGAEPRSDAELLLDLLDRSVIEPQRRALREAELTELALISGQWSAQVHRHLRRVMLLARIADPAARELALDRGLEDLCLAEAALWIHTELGLADAARDALGAKCAILDRGEPLLDRVLGDPRGALAGYGLSLIGDEPAKMLGFDRFWWAPLGLMQTLATPSGMHPDEFVLPSEAEPAREAPPIEVKFEELSKRGDP